MGSGPIAGRKTWEVSMDLLLVSLTDPRYRMRVNGVARGDLSYWLVWFGLRGVKVEVV